MFRIICHPVFSQGSCLADRTRPPAGEVAAMTRTHLVRCLAALALPALTVTTATAANAADPAPHVGHVWTIVLENSEFEQTYIADRNSDPYLSQTLTSEGMLVPGYFGTGHSSLDNYIAMASGQGPNASTQGDCDTNTTLGGGPPDPAPDASAHTWHFDAHGQAVDDSGATTIGCTYPAAVKNISDQLEAAGISWKGYMENMDAQNGTRSYCSNPFADRAPIAPAGGWQQARVDDQNPTNPDYKNKHNPFAYFHSLFDQDNYCQQHVVPLGYLDATGANPQGQLIDDLKSITTTPQYSFITPDQCHDGHDGCASSGGDAYAGVDQFLKAFIPAIVNSEAYKKDGLIIITTDEGDSNLVCCGEKKGPNLSTSENNGGSAGPVADGGGQTGAVLLSPFIIPGSVDATHQFNHYSYLRSVEDIFGLPHLGYAAAAGLTTFQDAGDIPAGAPGPALPEAPSAVLLVVAAAAAVAGTTYVQRRRQTAS
jgi:phosphatidylinositol-3-phosphatase